MKTTAPARVCLIPDCDRDASGHTGGGRGWCATHYMRWRRHGDPLYGGPVLRQARKGDPCSVGDCTGPAVARGWCSRHYGRWKRHRDPLAGRAPVGLDPAERFWLHVNQTGPLPTVRPDLGPCWVWESAVNGSGYGTFTAHDNRYMAHRFSWLLDGRTLTAGMTLDHLCRHIVCVRPTHLEEVTDAENKRRAMA